MTYSDYSDKYKNGCSSCLFCIVSTSGIKLVASFNAHTEHTCILLNTNDTYRESGASLTRYVLCYIIAIEHLFITTMAAIWEDLLGVNQSMVIYTSG